MSKRVGIIGAGQLGVYLCQAARGMGMTTTVLTKESGAPAVAEADAAIVADYDDETAIRRLCDAVDRVTFEFEDVPESTLVLLELLQAESVVDVFPHPKTLRLIKNKAVQKQWLQQKGFPTSQFVVCDDSPDFAAIAAELGVPFVQKVQTGGFDGRGVQVLTADSAASIWPTPSLAEVFVEYERELSVLVARNPSGEIAVYPLVEQQFSADAFVLQMAFSPAEIAADVELRARSLGAEIVRELDGVGVFAIELFLTANDELLVNEISPRVHNSGHMTLEAHSTSQFDQHLRAIFDLPLGAVTQLHPAVMVNILFEDSMQRFCQLPVSCWHPDPHTATHWYGKTEGREGRKMGHITSTAKSLVEASGLVSSALSALSNDEERVA
jgi:5-(carboxyamino)imidazole ribonucleotide synthase